MCRATFIRSGLPIAAIAIGIMTAVSGVVAQSRPVIERLEPTSGPPGIEVQIIGRRIHRDSTLYLGDTKLEILRRMPHRWSVRVPEGAETGPLIIDAPDGRYRGPSFRVTKPPPPPEIEDIEPRKGPPGSEVRITGKHFSARLADNEVTFGGQAVVVRSATPTSLRVTVPEEAESGRFVVKVTHAGEAKSPSFEVVAGTRIDGFSPRVGPPGSEITIEGEGFARTKDDNRVYLGNKRMTVVRVRPRQLVARVPEGEEVSTGPILVDVRGAGRAETEVPFHLQRRPNIAEFEPRRATAGDIVTIRGAHFGTDPQAVRVSVGERPMVLLRTRPSSLRVLVPPGAPNGKLRVSVHGFEADSDQELSTRPALRIARFEPRSGPEGTQVTIHGTGFAEDVQDNRVTLSHTPATVKSASSTQLKIEIPHASSGPLRVEVEGVGVARSEQPFIRTQPPRIVRLEPGSGEPGSKLTIRGSNFGSDANLVQVALGGQPMEIESVAEDQIVAVVPEDAQSGTVRVSVRLQGSTSSNQTFEVKR